MPNVCGICKLEKGFSEGKIAVGGVLLGPVGLIGGELGKKKSSYYCGKC